MNGFITGWIEMGLNGYSHSSCYTDAGLKWVNLLNSNPTKQSNTLKQFVRKLPSVFDHFVGLAVKGLNT